MGVFKRAFDIARSAAERNDIRIDTDPEFISAFHLYDLACEQARAQVAAMTDGNLVGEGDIMGQEYRRLVEKKLAGLQNLAFSGWRPSGEGAAYVKDFSTPEARSLAQDVLALVDVGGHVLMSRSYEEQFPPNEQLGYDMPDFAKQQHARETATRLSARKDEMDLLLQYEGISQGKMRE